MPQGYLIYGLKLSGTCQIRYVGKTTKGFDRLKDHLNKARWGHSSAKYDWIRSHGPAKIEFVVLEDCPDGDSSYLNQAEIRWIAGLLAEGSDLLNHTSGGDGGPTRKGMRTPEATKLKQQKARIGWRHSEASKRTLSEIRKSQIYRVCCLICQKEFSTGLNLSTHLRQSHNEAVLRKRRETKLAENVASNQERLSRYGTRYPDGTTGSCMACRLSFGYPGLKAHMKSAHEVHLPSSDKKKWRRLRLDNNHSVL